MLHECDACGACFSLRSSGHPSRPGYPSGVPRIYTKTGDDGTTGRLYGGRVSKADAATEASGAIDETVAALGVARAACEDGAVSDELLGLQRDLFVVGADVAANPAQRVKLEAGASLATDAMVEALEDRIDALVAEHPLPNAFVVPGATTTSAALDVARATARRAERRVVALREGGADVNQAAVRYLNRLSDLLFVMARWQAGESEPLSR
jgi:cob(I)alamin adenosyltransferase